MKLRRPGIKDVPQIQAIADKFDFILPTKFEHAAVVEKDEKVIAFGILRNILEAVIVTDGSDREKVASIKALINRGIKDAQTLKRNEVHVFVTNESFANILETHFNFKPAEGKCLVLKIEETNGEERR